MEYFEIISPFFIAFIGSFGHCLGMCGGIVLAYSSKCAQHGGKLFSSHMLYNLGRVTTYTLLGAIVGSLGGFLGFNEFLRASLFICAGTITILAGLSLFGQIKFLHFIEYAIQNSKWYQTRFHNALLLANQLKLYILGTLNGLLPCGFVYAFLFSAIGFANALKGALVMLAFGLGTIPALLTLGLLSHIILQKSLFQKPILRKAMINLAAIAIVIFGASMLQRGVQILQTGDEIPLSQHSQGDF